MKEKHLLQVSETKPRAKLITDKPPTLFEKAIFRALSYDPKKKRPAKK